MLCVAIVMVDGVEIDRGGIMLPKDPNMLLSVINMKLRDFYPSLDALCEDMDEDMESIVCVLSEAGYTYDPGKNAFV